MDVVLLPEWMEKQFLKDVGERLAGYNSGDHYQKIFSSAATDILSADGEPSIPRSRWLS